MRSGIKEFQPRQPLDRQLGAGTLNQILRELESLRITRVVNGTFRKLPGGTEITVAPQRGGTSTPATRQPWDLIARQDPDNENQYLVRVQPGTLNGILPTNWDEEFNAAATGLHYAKAVITTDGEAITDLTIAIDTSPPDPQEPIRFQIPLKVEFLFGLFTEGAAYRVIANGDIRLPTTIYRIASANPAAAPGESPYDYFYTLGP
jgi:hypothetical protein